MYNGIYPVNINRYVPPVKKQKPKELTPDPQESQKAKQQARPQDQGGSLYGSKHSGAIDYTSTKVNISQILVDFKNTLTAIGAPKDVEKEVQEHLEQVNLQSNEEKPSRKVITENLRSAAHILDKYIAATLKKPSNVVEGWIDALLLQQIDYKSNKEVKIKPETKVAEIKTTQEPQVNPTEKTEEPQKAIIAAGPYLPENAELRKIYIKAQKFKEIGKNEKALAAFAKAIKYAKKIDDKKTQAYVFLNVGEIQDASNKIPEALKSLNNAAKLGKNTKEHNLKAKVHFNMGQIYDEVGKFEAAMDHYFAALSFNGECANINSQAMTLNNIGAMHADKFQYKPALGYLKEALILAKEVPDFNAMGEILNNTAGVFKVSGDDKKALKYYGSAIKCNAKVKKYLECSFAYEKAGDIMIEMENYKKASQLYQKAVKSAQKSQNKERLSELFNKIKSFETNKKIA